MCRVPVEFPSKGKVKIPGSTALVRKDFKYFHYQEWDVEQLFNLQEDPLEEYNVIEDPQHAELVVEMRQRHNELQAQAK
jgi:arylsulfatase